MTTDPKQLPPPSNKERIKKLIARLHLGLWWEKLYPLLAGIACGWLIYRTAIDKRVFGALLKDVIPAALSIAAIFAGFQGAVHAILLTMLRSRIVRAMRRTDAYDRLISFVRAGFTTLITFVIAALTVLVLNSFDALSDRAVKWSAAILIALFVWSLLASVRITLLEVKMLASPDDVG